MYLLCSTSLSISGLGPEKLRCDTAAFSCTTLPKPAANTSATVHTRHGLPYTVTPYLVLPVLVGQQYRQLTHGKAYASFRLLYGLAGFANFPLARKHLLLLVVEFGSILQNRQCAGVVDEALLRHRYKLSTPQLGCRNKTQRLMAKSRRTRDRGV